MTVRATIEASKGREQRSVARKTLRLTVSGRRANSEATEVLIHDLSATGLLIESSAAVKIGEKIAVDLPRAGLREAAVVWSSTRFFGCRFAERLPSAAVSAALLRAEPAQDLREESEASPPTDFGARLTALREVRGLSVEQLAGHLRVSRQALWYWETGQRAPRKNMLTRIAREFGLSDAQLKAADEPRRTGPGVVERCKEEVAAQYGVPIERVKIVVEL
jgi:transcriptional regulator with XRE-family HTH domain